jgi:hypothetical protein
MKRMGTSTMTAVALLAGVMMTSAAGAAPASSSQAIANHVNGQSDAMVQSVRDGWGRRGRHGHRHHRHGGWGGGGWGAAAAAGLLLSAPLWAGGTYAYDEPYDSDGGYEGGYAEYNGGGVARCEATFRSFDPASGTYMGYDGIRRTCPYL